MSETQKQAIGPNQEEWLRALEGDEYKQCTENLGFIFGGREHNCCLGVAARICGSPRRVCDIGAVMYGEPNETTGGFAPDAVVQRLALHSYKGVVKGMKFHECQTLASANDNGATFAEIAAFCRAHPEAVFTEPR